MPATKKPTARRAKTTPELPYIASDLHPLARPVDQFSQDPRNARQHGDRSIDEIRRSLEQFGQRKPIVAHRDTGVVIAGNGSLQAALLLGWTHIAAVLVDDDARTATGFAIADNRSAEFSTWDTERLQELLAELDEAGLPSVGVGFTDDELEQLTAQAMESVAPPHDERNAGDQTGELKGKFQVLVDCADELDQQSFLGQMQVAGRSCRVLNS